MRRAVVALVALLAFAAESHGGRQAAQALVEAGAKAMAAKDWQGALAQFEAAAKEEPTLLAAHRGWAEAAVAAGQPERALAVLHAAVLEGEARETLPEDDVEALVALRRKLAELDPASAAVEALLRKHGDALASLSAKYLAKDPEFAEAACRAALAVMPGHAAAKDRLSRIMKANAGKKVRLFNGRNFTGWMWAEPGKWEVRDGMIVATVMQDAMVIRTNPRFDGDFDLLMEVQVKERGPGPMPLYFALEGAYEGDDAYVSFGVMNERLLLCNCIANRVGGEKELWSAALTDLAPPLDPGQWTTYELQFSGATLRALVNGKIVHTASRPDGWRGGYVAVKAQGGVVHVRRLEVVPR